MTATAIVDGRAVVLGNISRVPGDRFFDAVRYLVDRVCELVDVKCFYADAAYDATKVCRYIEHINETYRIRKGERSRVKEVLNGFSGRADWTEYKMNSPRLGVSHHTNLVAVEKRGKIEETKQGVSRVEGSTQTELPSESPSGQLTLEDVAKEDDVEYVAFVTNEDIDSIGVDPARNPVGHDSSNTVWGVAEGYRRRWSIETCFRQLKYQFKAKTRSRDPGQRRFYWMMAMLLYNAWAAVNLMVQNSVPTASGEEPPIRARVFLEEIARVFEQWPPP